MRYKVRRLLMYFKEHAMHSSRLCIGAVRATSCFLMHDLSFKIDGADDYSVGMIKSLIATPNISCTFYSKVL